MWPWKALAVSFKHGPMIIEPHPTPLPISLRCNRYVPLSIAALFIGSMAPAQRHFQLALFGLFLVANVILFQPWEVGHGWASAACRRPHPPQNSCQSKLPFPLPPPPRPPTPRCAGG